MFGIKGIQVKTFDVQNKQPDEVNEFLTEYDGNIIDIRTEQLMYGVTRYIIIYRAVESV